MTTESTLQSACVDLASRRYFNALQMALADFQYIEECLRFFLAAAYAYIKNQVKEKLPFNYDYSDVENDALGRLIQKYSKLSNDRAMAEKLRKLLKKRNEIAHRGLLLTTEEHRNVEFLESQAEGLEALHLELRPCIQDLLNERSSLTGERQVVI